MNAKLQGNLKKRRESGLMTHKVGQNKEKKTRKRGSLSLVDNNPKMFREPNYENYISDIDISVRGQNSDSDMVTFRNCEWKGLKFRRGT